MNTQRGQATLTAQEWRNLAIIYLYLTWILRTELNGCFPSTQVNEQLACRVRAFIKDPCSDDHYIQVLVASLRHPTPALGTGTSKEH